MLTAPDLPFLLAGPEEEEASPFLELCLDQRLAFFLTDLNLRRWLKLSLAAGVMVTDVSADDSLGAFLSRLLKHPSHILCCGALGLNCLPHDAQSLATSSSIILTAAVWSRGCLPVECEEEWCAADTAE